MKSKSERSNAQRKGGGRLKPKVVLLLEGGGMQGSRSKVTDDAQSEGGGEIIALEGDLSKGADYLNRSSHIPSDLNSDTSIFFWKKKTPFEQKG